MLYVFLKRLGQSADFVADQMHRACQLIGAEPMVVEEFNGPLTDSQPEVMDIDGTMNKRK